jgi:hypothetical protein
MKWRRLNSGFIFVAEKPVSGTMTLRNWAFWIKKNMTLVPQPEKSFL